MKKYIDLLSGNFTGTLNWLLNEITHPSITNYFYWLTGLSLLFFLLELSFPWRKGQPRYRKDFWLDAFYMYFNFFIFSALGFGALMTVFSELFNDLWIAILGFDLRGAISADAWPLGLQLGVMFLIKDFISWLTHILLHRIPALWEFHKVHHSVEQMGFAAHLRYHWMENIVYKTTQYIPLALIGFTRGEHLLAFFLMDQFTIVVGHWNHTNVRIPLGPLKYVLNSPEMHIWHHARTLPADKVHGVNFGITLSIWDYLFRTNYQPGNGRDIPLGFEDLEDFPDDFLKQQTWGFGRHRNAAQLQVKKPR